MNAVAHSASAPGKLVLAGEYAVTEGCGALVSAVDVRAHVRVTPSVQLELQGNGPARVDALRQRDEARRQLPLLAAVVDQLDAAALLSARGALRVDTQAFAFGGVKVGIGSSAAACVATVRALLPAASLDVVHAQARAAHRAFQGGGSGIDVAASSLGGVLWFQGGGATPAPAPPSAVAWVTCFVGHATATQGFVDGYRALADRERHRDALAAAALRLRDAFAHASDTEVFAAIDDARNAMGQMGTAAGIDVVSAPHLTVAQLARAHGGAAKPSGAGGGDVAVCAVPHERRSALASELARAGMLVLDLQLGAAGARLEPA